MSSSVYKKIIVPINDFLSNDKRTFQWLERYTKRILKASSFKKDTIHEWEAILYKVRVKKFKVGYALNKEIKKFVDEYIQD